MSFTENNLHFCDICMGANGLENYGKPQLLEINARLKAQINKFPNNKFSVENLCFGGGGIKTMGYIGGLHVLSEYNLLNNIKRIAASSAGTTLALLLALSYDIDGLYESLNTDTKKYLDRNIWNPSDLFKMVSGNFGIHSGKYLVTDIQAIINNGFDKKFPNFRKERAEQKNIQEYNPTLLDIYEQFGIELVLSATNLTTNKVEYFSPKISADMPAYLAARISMSYPFVFEFVEYNNCVYIDSINTYPLNVFYDQSLDLLFSSPDNMLDKTVGFNNLYGPSDPTQKITNMQDFIGTLAKTVSIYIDTHQIELFNIKNSRDYKAHTIAPIISHIKTMDLELGKTDKLDLLTLYKIFTLGWLDNMINKT